MTGRFHKFIITVILTGLTGMVTVNMLWDWQLTRTFFMKHTAAEIQLEVDRSLFAVESFMDECIGMTKQIASEYGLKLLNLRDSGKQGLKEMLTRPGQKESVITRIQIADEKGKIIGDSQGITEDTFMKLPPENEFSWASPYITEPEYSRLSKKFSFNILLPIYKGGIERIGYTSVTYDMSGIFYLVDEDGRIGKTGEIYIIDRKGQVLTPLRLKDNAVLSQKIEAPLQIYHKHNRTASDLPVYTNYIGKQVLGVSRYVPLMNWFIVGELQINEIYKDARNLLLWILILHAAFFVVISAIVYFFVNQGMSSLGKLKEGINYVLEGRFNYRFGKIANNEIGELAVSIDKLLDKLQARIDQTEERISQSTNELREKLRQYHNQNQLLNDIRRASLNLMEDLEEERQNIESSEVKIRTIIASAMDAIIVVGANNLIDSFNPAAERMFGYSALEMIGSPISTLWPEEDRFRFDQAIQSSLSIDGQRVVHFQPRQLEGQTKRGKKIPLEISLGSMHIAHKTWAVVILRDITERKHFEEEMLRQKKSLEKANLELDSFVYMASHDLRAPLRGISAFATFLEMDCSKQLDDTGRDYIKEIKKGAQRLDELIDDLLNLSRMSRMKNPYEQVDINALIQHVKNRMEFDFRQHNVQLIVKENIPLVKCDRIKMAEVFFNLIGNAIKFSSKDQSPRVEIGYIDRGDYHEIYVKDNGIGIDPKYHKNIFGIFKRLHTMEEYEGTGAGLSIVERIILDHSGQIWVESELGKGATFIFRIPKNPA